MSPLQVKPPPILLAEDHPADISLVRLALEASRLSNPLFVARDGQQTIDYLAGKAPYDARENFPLPGLVLLDLMLPRVNGFEVLAWLQSRPELSYLSVVVLSDSDNQQDATRAMLLGA